MKPIMRVILIATALIVVAFVLLRSYCPVAGLALTKQRAEFHKLKNRTALPQPTDFDERVTLEALLQPGDDRARWSTARAARIEGFVTAVSAGPFEAANCFCDRDVHVMLALRANAPSREQIVLEVTPRIETNPSVTSTASKAATIEGQIPAGDLLKDWSRETLAQELVGRRVRIEGWLLCDESHAGESENIAPGRANNWRATAWEIHPITRIETVR